MNTEQLQMVINAIQTLGIEGKSAFIWWLVLDKLTPVVVTSIVVGAGTVIALRTLKLLQQDK